MEVVCPPHRVLARGVVVCAVGAHSTPRVARPFVFVSSGSAGTAGGQVGGVDSGSCTLAHSRHSGGRVVARRAGEMGSGQRRTLTEGARHVHDALWHLREPRRDVPLRQQEGGGSLSSSPRAIASSLSLTPARPVPRGGTRLQVCEPALHFELELPYRVPSGVIRPLENDEVLDRPLQAIQRWDVLQIITCWVTCTIGPRINQARTVWIGRCAPPSAR